VSDMYYPSWVCAKCGEQYGRKLAGSATWHQGACGVCLADAAVTEPRDYGHLRDEWRKHHESAKTANQNRSDDGTDHERQ
jgi:hypothetical protein